MGVRWVLDACAMIVLVHMSTHRIWIIVRVRIRVRGRVRVKVRVTVTLTRLKYGLEGAKFNPHVHERNPNRNRACLPKVSCASGGWHGPGEEA